MRTANGAPAEIVVEAQRRGRPHRAHRRRQRPGHSGGDRERVVERFVRLEQSRSRAGLGPGLSLASAVARLHGGELQARGQRAGPARPCSCCRAAARNCRSRANSQTRMRRQRPLRHDDATPACQEARRRSARRRRDDDSRSCARSSMRRGSPTARRRRRASPTGWRRSARSAAGKALKRLLGDVAQARSAAARARRRLALSLGPWRAPIRSGSLSLLDCRSGRGISPTLLAKTAQARGGEPRTKPRRCGSCAG